MEPRHDICTCTRERSSADSCGKHSENYGAAAIPGYVTNREARRIRLMAPLPVPALMFAPFMPPPPAVPPVPTLF